jgi:hypothetical protein
MNTTRRDFVRLGIGAAVYVPARRLLAQGVSSHTALRRLYLLASPT